MAWEIIVIAVFVLIVLGRIAWEIATKQPHSNGEALGGWFGEAGEPMSTRRHAKKSDQ